MNNNESKFQPRHLLLILCIVCVVLIILSSISSSVNSAVRGVLNDVLTPMQSGFNKVGSFVSDEAEDLARLSAIEEDYKALTDELAYLREQNTRYQLQEIELSKYRDLLGMKEEYEQYPTIGAHVIGENSSNWNHTVLIDRGASDGIEVNMNVIAQGGLAGIVTSVTAGSSTVRLITDHDSQVGAMALITQDTCIVRGDLEVYQEGRLILEKINKDAKISDDYKIVTSNKSSIYLPGILIGYAKDIDIDSNSLTKSGYLVPVVDFSHLDTVLVITQLKENGQ
ncbi:MAG: rod shape-determining protein MreC [Lachnospiraceae bacterium]|nr:rod shape-determining protein MreC [Lachnospiraceae bacterium]